MEKTKHNKILVLMIILAVAAGMVFLLLLHLRQPQGAATKKKKGAPESTSKEQGEPEMIAARPGPVLESPLLNEDAEEAKKVIQEDSWLMKKEDGVFTYLPLGNMEKPHTDIAMVEFRFLKKNQKGEMEKLFVEHISAYQRIGRKSKRVNTEWEFGSPVISVEAYALRVGAALPGTGFRFLGFGKRYHLKYKAIDAESGDPLFFDSIIKVPEHIPAGKMAVIEVLAKPELSGGYAIPRNPPQPDTRIQISGKITTPLPPTETEWMVAYNHHDKNISGFTGIEEDGSFDLGKREPNGMLRLAERGRTGVPWIIIDSVDKSQLTLPEDADRIIPRDSLRDIEIVIPEEPDIETFSGIWVVDDKEGLGPIACQTAPSRYEPEKLEQFYERATLRMKAPPGKYWVKAFYDPSREWIDLGWITIPEKDGSGRVPKLRPVLE